ncbi:MAG: bifunctional diaminohydroxyphosphoribosylaminopyrimidine deaminase/5-amino-6-(5-phosphoribosylamino)uracil reductase RibD [Propionibacteriales bacterium]|nr:bifunctional diaminohydroxyphosphoribosylaminopyrimidine deaminase/5-amino-6-(5-phosphoribosylamino)uracil reductase RibD [Propionibacteriales bacterium]
MRQALVLACTPGVPLGPNPRVGAVILDEHGAIIAAGYHRGVGTPHAEVVALAAAGNAARGGTSVVSLEPCNHVGRTRPCTQALLDAGVQRVVFAQADPNPVAAGGAAALAAAGVDVEDGILAVEAETINEVWSAAMRMRRPFVTWKLATTLDGRSAAADGSSRWITGHEARTDVQRLRRLCDALVVGTGTVETDDPWLTLRDEQDVPLPRSEQPLRVVIGIRDLDPAARVFDDAADTIVLPTHDPADALAQLFAQDRQHVWLEGGPTLAGSFLQSGLVDEVIAYVAPALLGAGVAAVTDLGIATMADIRRFHLLETTRIGDDVRMILRPTAPADEKER